MFVERLLGWMLRLEEAVLTTNSLMSQDAWVLVRIRLSSI
jgi:hypothetical protein